MPSTLAGASGLSHSIFILHFSVVEEKLQFFAECAVQDGEGCQ